MFVYFSDSAPTWKSGEMSMIREKYSNQMEIKLWNA